jgi:hypothetical protein
LSEFYVVATTNQKFAADLDQALLKYRVDPVEIRIAWIHGANFYPAVVAQSRELNLIGDNCTAAWTKLRHSDRIKMTCIIKGGVMAIEGVLMMIE